MTTQYVTYCTSKKPDCAFVKDAPVIICLEDSALVVQPEVECGIPISTINATICAAASFQQGCQTFTYQYTFAYDDEQIVDTDRGLLSSDITGFLCEDCLTTFILEQISCITSENGPIVPVDTESVDLTVSGPGDHTLQADVNVSADDGNTLEIRADGLYAGSEHTSDVFYENGPIAGVGALSVGVYNIQDVTYSRVADALRGTCFTDAYGFSNVVAFTAGAEIVARTLISADGGPFSISTEQTYNNGAGTTILPVGDFSRGNPSTTKIAGAPTEAITIRFQLEVTNTGAGGISHVSGDYGVSSLRTTR